MPPNYGPTWDAYRRLEDTIAKLEDETDGRHVANIERLSKIETILEDATTKLFGNGQPGILEKYEARIHRLEVLAVKLGAIAGVLIFLIELMHNLPLKEMFGGK